MGTKCAGIGAEATFGTPVALAEYISFNNYTPTINNNIQADHESGYLMKPKPMPGKFQCGFTMSFWVEPENIGYWIAAFCGSGADATTNPAGSDYLHTFTLQEAEQYLTVAISSDITAGERRYTSCCLKSLKLTLNPGEKVLAEVEVFAQTVNTQANSSPSYSTLNPLMVHQSDLKIATSSDTDIKTMVIEFVRHWDEDEYTANSRLLRKGSSTGITVTGTMDLLYDDLDQTEFVLGPDGSTAPATTLTLQQIDADIDSGVKIGADGNYLLNIELKETLYNTEGSSINKQDRVIQNLAFEAFQTDSGTEPVTIQLQNSESSSYC